MSWVLRVWRGVLHALIWLTLATNLALLAGCTGGGAAADLQGDWSLIAMNGTAPLAGAEITLGFIDDQLGGSSGCNQYGGRYSLAGKRLRIEDLAQTEMACLDGAVTEQETAYLSALLEADEMRVEDDRLTLTGQGVELVYERVAE